MNTARDRHGQAGTQTSAIVMGGQPPGTGITTTETYNGTSWTSGGSLNTTRSVLAGAGPNTASIAFGGGTPTITGATELYNGTSWTTSTSMTTGRSYLGSAGTQPAGLAFAGFTGTTRTNATEEFTNNALVVPVAGSWSSGGNMNTTRAYLGSVGLQTASLGFGGYLQPFTPSTATESYNGSSWTSVTSMSTARGYGAGCGTQTAALGSGGQTPTTVANTEEFTGEIATATSKTLTTS